MTVLTLCVLLSFLSYTQANFQNGDLRLVSSGGSNGGSFGRLEVYYSGQWGTVCDDSFGANDANVACRQLGFTQGYCWGNVRAFGLPSGSSSTPILLDNLGCTSNDSLLIKCRHNGIGNTNCIHSEDVAVACTPRRDCNGRKSTSLGVNAYYYSGGSVSAGFFIAACCCYFISRSYSRNRGSNSRNNNNNNRSRSSINRTALSTSVAPPRVSRGSRSAAVRDSQPSTRRESSFEPTKDTWISQPPPSYFTVVGSQDYDLPNSTMGNQTAIEMVSSGDQMQGNSVSGDPPNPPIDEPPPPYPSDDC